MKVRYKGTSQGYNEILGEVEPDHIYEVPKDSEEKFLFLGDYEVMEQKGKKYKVDRVVDEGE